MISVDQATSNEGVGGRTIAATALVASSSTLSSTFFLLFAEEATPLALFTRTKVSSFAMSACCLS